MGKRTLKSSPWQRIMEAAYEGKGIRLTADEVFELSCDGAIEQMAMNDCEEQGIWPKWAGEAPTDPRLCSEGGFHEVANPNSLTDHVCRKCEKYVTRY